MQDKQDLQQLQLAATILAVSRAGSMCPGLETTHNPHVASRAGSLYPGLETTIYPPVSSQQTPDSSSAVNPASLASALKAASASDETEAPAQAAASADESSASAQAAAAVQNGSAANSSQGASGHPEAASDATHQESHVSHKLVPETVVNSPRAAPGSPKSLSHAGIDCYHLVLLAFLGQEGFGHVCFMQWVSHFLP